MAEEKQIHVPEQLREKLNDESLEKIAACIDAAEAKTSGELRVHINYRLMPFQKSRPRAVQLFHELKMDQTRGRTGVLLFFSLHERSFEIVADSGINSKVEPETWSHVANDLTETIHKSGLAEGICFAVQKIGAILSVHVPREHDDSDELTNRVSLQQNDQEHS